jgi:hypothetical protein
MEEAKLVAVGPYRLVLEDGPEIETPKNSPDQSSDDHGEDGKPGLERAVMTTDQARMLKERGVAGSGTVSGPGRQETSAGNVR